jgi:hypothetical protein
MREAPLNLNHCLIPPYSRYGSGYRDRFWASERHTLPRRDSHLSELFVPQGDHGIDAHGVMRGHIRRGQSDKRQE